MSETKTTGKVLDGRYRIDERLGSGTRHKAWDERLERHVVAVLPEETGRTSAERMDAFIDRARGLTRISHPHLVRVLDAGRHEGAPFAVSEYIEGESLRERMGEPGRQSSTDILTWLEPIAAGLDHLHGEDFVHGDVSYENILFDGNGNACLTGAAAASPQGGKEVDRIAFASEVYRAVTGEYPRPCESYQVVVSALSGRLPLPATRVLGRALSPDPSERYSTCTEFAQAFKAALDEKAPFFMGDEDSGAWFLERVRRGELLPMPASVRIPRPKPVVPETPARVRRRRSWASLVVFGAVVLLVAGVLSYTVWVTGNSGLREVADEVVQGSTLLARAGEYGEALARMDRFLDRHPRAGSVLDPVREAREKVTESRRIAHMRALTDGLKRLARAKTPEGCDEALERLREAERVMPAAASAAAVERALEKKREFEAVAAREAGRSALLRAWNATESGDLETAAQAYRQAAHDLAAFGADGPATNMALQLEALIGRFDAAMEKARSLAAADDRFDEALAALDSAREVWPEGYEREGGEALRTRIERSAADRVRRSREEQYGRHIEAARAAVREGRHEDARRAYAAALEVKVTEEARDGYARCDALRRYEVKLSEGSGLAEKGRWAEAVDAFSAAERIATQAGIDAKGARTARATAVRKRDESGARSAERSRRIDKATVYSPATRERFERLLASEDWSAAETLPSTGGLLEAVHEPTGLTFVLVPAGTFWMGSRDHRDEKPAHFVTVRAFLLAKTECTQEAWEKAGGRDRSHFTGEVGLPVEMVSWTEARGWCAGAGLRLPSEAEWEYSCRAGTETAFSTGDEPGSLAGHANIADAHLRDHPVEAPGRGAPFEHTEAVGDGRSGTAPAGSYRPNAWGLLDTHGNVREWCEDRFHGSYDEAPTDGSPWRDGVALTRICRGGGWADPADYARSANRSYESATLRFPDVGFRPAADLPD